MGTMNSSSWSTEAWNVVCGPDRSPEDVISEAESSNMTPQSWLLNAIDMAVKAGAYDAPTLSDEFKEALSAGEVFGDLCRQTGIAWG